MKKVGARNKKTLTSLLVAAIFFSVVPVVNGAKTAEAAPPLSKVWSGEPNPLVTPKTTVVLGGKPPVVDGEHVRKVLDQRPQLAPPNGKPGFPEGAPTAKTWTVPSGPRTGSTYRMYDWGYSGGDPAQPPLLVYNTNGELVPTRISADFLLPDDLDAGWSVWGGYINECWRCGDWQHGGTHSTVLAILNDGKHKGEKNNGTGEYQMTIENSPEPGAIDFFQRDYRDAANNGREGWAVASMAIPGAVPNDTAAFALEFDIRYQTGKTCYPVYSRTPSWCSDDSMFWIDLVDDKGRDLISGEDRQADGVSRFYPIWIGWPGLWRSSGRTTADDEAVTQGRWHARVQQTDATAHLRKARENAGKRGSGVHAVLRIANNKTDRGFWLRHFRFMYLSPDAWGKPEARPTGSDSQFALKFTGTDEAPDSSDGPDRAVGGGPVGGGPLGGAGGGHVGPKAGGKFYTCEVAAGISAPLIELRNIYYAGSLDCEYQGKKPLVGRLEVGLYAQSALDPAGMGIYETGAKNTNWTKLPASRDGQPNGDSRHCEGWYISKKNCKFEFKWTPPKDNVDEPVRIVNIVQVDMDPWHKWIPARSRTVVNPRFDDTNNGPLVYNTRMIRFPEVEIPVSLDLVLRRPRVDIASVYPQWADIRNGTNNSWIRRDNPYLQEKYRTECRKLWEARGVQFAYKDPVDGLPHVRACHHSFPLVYGGQVDHALNQSYPLDCMEHNFTHAWWRYIYRKNSVKYSLLQPDLLEEMQDELSEDKLVQGQDGAPACRIDVGGGDFNPED